MPHNTGLSGYVPLNNSVNTETYIKIVIIAK